MRSTIFHSWVPIASVVLAAACIAVPVVVAQTDSFAPPRALTDQQSQSLDRAVETALAWLASTQQRDGSYPALPTGQPGITSLVTLAFLSAGHLPDSEPYGKNLDRAVKFALNCQRDDGLINVTKPAPVWQFDAPSHTGYYNHAITALMLSEISGELHGEQRKQVTTAIERAMDFTIKRQLNSIPGRPQDEGGWRYPAPHPTDRFKTDLSITAWQLTFLRSAKNASFDVNPRTIEAAEKYVKGLYKQPKKNFTYDHMRVTRGMTGAGIMAMAMLGKHHSKESNSAADWIKQHPFKGYGETVGQLDRFQYSVYYCTQGMYQLGGEDFEAFFPRIVDLLVDNQNPDGSWSAVDYERRFGNAYATSMSVLALTTHYAMLPIHQR